MYKVSAKQLVLLAIVSAVIAGALIIGVQRIFTKNGIAEVSLEPTVIADPSVATDEQNNIDVYRTVSPGVVFITSKSYVETWYGVYPQEGSGSGSIIDDQGHILTNYHVVQGAAELEVLINNEKYPARLIGRDRDNDLAVIKVEAPRDKLTVVKLGTSKGLQVGQKVLAIGNPFGLQKTLTTGVISGLERPLQDPQRQRVIQGAIQTDASINPGNSGGPLLNPRGEMIGINTMIYSPSGGSVGIGFAVPVDTAKRIVPDLIARGRVPKPWLGVSGLPITRQMVRRLNLSVDSGMLVVNVYRGSGAAQAGVRSAVIDQDPWGSTVLRQLGDVIVAVNGQQVANSEDMQNAVKGKKVGETVEVEVLRQGRRLTVPIRLTDTPEESR
jgi:S1-C subfamily serine protease